MKKCTKCKIEKPVSDYGVDKSTKDGYRYSCKECYNSQQREYARKNKDIIKSRNAKKSQQRKAYYKSKKGIESSRRAHLKRAFGITLEDYNNLFEKQGGVCKICQQKEKSKINNFLSVDHSHLTGKIRGLLCSDCNRGLGLLKDSKQNLINAVKYLENE
jgi:ERCC4-type nuclease